MEPYIWLKDCGYHYEHISVYVDPLLIVSKDHKDLVDILTNKHKFKLKWTSPMSYHVGCVFERDDDCTIHLAPRKNIEKMIECHVNMFGSKPKLNFMSPLEKDDHPELDASEYLD